MAAIMSRRAAVRLAGLKTSSLSTTSPATLHAAAGFSIRRLQSTFANKSYENIKVDTVGQNSDISLITLNRPKAVCYGSPHGILATCQARRV